jgi:hypothetical protein
MSSSQNRSSTLEVKLITGSLVYTYLIYMVGGLYISGSLLGFAVLGLVLLRAFVKGTNPLTRMSPIVIVWAVGMFLMLVSLLVAHGQWDLGTAKTIKSSVGWAKGWALFALFIFLGTRVHISTDIFVRAVCKVGAYSFVFGLLSLFFYMVGSSGQLYISPLKIIGGTGDNFFTVSLYGYNPETGAGRWQFFAPWAPAAGLIACTFVLICLLEKDRQWRLLGACGFALMVLLSQSRVGLAMFVFIIPLFYFSRIAFNPFVLILLGLVIPAVLFLGEPVYEWMVDTHQTIKDARPASTRVRTTLENIALQRWRAEAPIWGHGIVESGPKLVEFMPIGSHHTWLGLLFVKGWVGCFALAVPLTLSMVVLLVKHQASEEARASLCMMLILVGYSFFENIEILAYLIWPVFFWFGRVFQSFSEDSFFEVK